MFLGFLPKEERTYNYCKIVLSQNPKAIKFIPTTLQPIIKKELGL